MRRITGHAVTFGLGIIFLATFAEILARGFGLPNVPSIVVGVRTLWREGTLQHDVQVSMARWFLGWAIGASIGVALGLLTGRVKAASLTIEGFLVLCRAVPFISLLPLCIRVFGLEERGKIFLVAWASAGVCWVVVHQAARTLPPQLLWRAKSLGVSKQAWVVGILLPACRVGIHSGLRAALSLGLIVIAVAEMSGVYERSSGLWWSEGLGYRLFRSLDESRDDLMMAAILTFAILGIAVDYAFVLMWHAMERITFIIQRKRVTRDVAAARALPIGLDAGWAEPVPLEVNGLHAGYDGTMIFSNTSFSIRAGETMSVVGPSGCGKTTLIRAIGHFTDEVFNTSGTVAAGSLHDKPGPWVGVVLQDAPVFEQMTVWDNLVIGNRFRKKASPAIQDALRLLTEFKLEKLVAQRGQTLSGGQRQRLALAMALANRPQVLLLDEPFGALDALTRRQLRHFYWQHVHGKVTAIFVTHDLEESLLVGDFVRVGVAPDSGTIEADKQGMSTEEWEFTDRFSALKAALLTALKRSSYV